MTDNAEDFPRESPGDKTARRLAEVLTRINQLAADQASEGARQQLGIKDETLALIIIILQKINRAANALAEDIDGIEDLFRMPRRRSDAIWLATARNFYDESAPFDAQFQDFDLSETFRADLLALIAEFEAAVREADIAHEQKGGATGGLEAEFREAGKFSRKLNAIVRNKYAENPRKLGAWEIASHLEAAPKREPKPPTQ
ncbi:MAG: hypothetical protein LUM44_19165 [Pyrinomonadaceae bacterium]|nr:hypothetical protein [Pyrinomonadaceae bacterium]